MKAILILLLGVSLFVTVSQAEEPMAAGQDHETTLSNAGIVLASSLEQIAGDWYAFPAGAAIRINDDGTADFGLDTAGEAIGYSARTWFEGQQLFFAFTNFDGESGECGTTAGSYTVQLLDDSSIAFRSVVEPCQLRSTILGDQPENGFELRFHPVRWSWVRRPY